MPALGGVAFAVLFFGAVLRRNELGKQRNDLGMAGRDRRRGEQGVVALHLAAGAFSPQAMRTAELLRAEILGAVPGDQDTVAKSGEVLAQRCRREQLLNALEARLQQRRIGGVEHVADVIVGGDFPDSEQGLAVRAPMAFLQGALEREKRGALHEKQRKRRKSDVRYRDVAAASLPGVRKACAHRAQSRKKGRQKLHPNGGITSPLIWESLKCARSPLLELLRCRPSGRPAKPICFACGSLAETRMHSRKPAEGQRR